MANRKQTVKVGINPISTYTSCLNNNTNSLTSVNFITEDRMLKNTYVYENRMFTKESDHSIIWSGKGKRVTLIKKSLINARV